MAPILGNWVIYDAINLDRDSSFEGRTVILFLNVLLLAVCGLPTRQLDVWIRNPGFGGCEHIHSTGSPVGLAERKEPERKPWEHRRVHTRGGSS